MSRADYFTWEENDVSISEDKKKAITNAATLDATAVLAIANYMPELTKGISETAYQSIKNTVSLARLQGKDVGWVEEQIAPLFGAERAQRIAVTETSRLFGVGSQAVYRQQGIRLWEWSTCNDPWVCAECEALEGEEFSIDKDFDPLHPGCRCWARPTIGTEDEPGDEEAQASEFAEEQGVDNPNISEYWRKKLASERSGIDLIKGLRPWEDPEGVRIIRRQLDQWADDNKIHIVIDEHVLNGVREETAEVARRIATGISQAREQLAVLNRRSYKPGDIKWQVLPENYFSRSSICADTFHDSKTIRINAESNIWQSDREAKKVADRGWWPRGTSSASDLITHEMAHVLQEHVPFNNFWGWRDVVDAELNYERVYGKRSAWTGVWNLQAIGYQVSQYAGANPHEFVAETYLGLLKGNTYSRDVMLLYEYLGGPDTKGVPLLPKEEK